jgi:hypothetical protein
MTTLGLNPDDMPTQHALKPLIIARPFMYQWAWRTWVPRVDAYEGKPIPYSASDQFASLGIRPGDTLYVVGFTDEREELLLIARFMAAGRGSCCRGRRPMIPASSGRKPSRSSVAHRTECPCTSVTGTSFRERTLRRTCPSSGRFHVSHARASSPRAAVRVTCFAIRTGASIASRCAR